MKNQYKIRKYMLMLMLLVAGSVFAQAPTVGSFTPARVTQKTVVTITGTNFDGATAVKFGGTNAASYSIVNNTTINATVSVNGSTGTVSVTTAAGTATSAASVTYVAPTATPSTAAINRIITDWNGYWSSTSATVAPNQPNTHHNLTAFRYGNTLYSTGVDNTRLNTSVGAANYTAADFRALPINTISGVTGGASYLAMGSLIDGSVSAATHTAPGIAGVKVRDVLIDGIKGLDLGTGVTNLNATAVLYFDVNNIVTSKISDAEPDILITQIASPSSVEDIYCFVDANGNIVGNPMSASLGSVGIVGTYRLDLFTLTTGSSYSTVTPSGSNEVNNTRDIRMIAFKLSDFGITSANSGTVAKFKYMPGGDSDTAFTAYNAGAFIIPAPVITAQPVSQVVCPGTGSATFSVTATGAPLTYQWRKDGVDIAGATSATYTIAAVQASNVATYSVLVTNESGSVLSNSVYLNTIIAVQPVATATCQSTATSINVVANGQSLTYQWYRNTANANTGGTSISGATSATYSPSVSAASNLYYYCVILNLGSGCAGATTNAVLVTVSAPVVAGTASANQSICTNNTTTVSITGQAGTIQWQESADNSNWANVTTGSGSTTATYTTPALTATTYYRAVVTSGACGNISSSAITVTVLPVSVAGTVSANQSVCSGTTATVSVSGYTGTIQWQRSVNNSVWNNITGATSATYTTTALTATTYYKAIITSGACSSATTGTTTVTVNANANAGTASANQIICSGTTATVSVADATGNIQWQQSANNSTWANINGATATTFTTPALTSAMYYKAVVSTGTCGTATSSVIVVSVSPISVAGTATGTTTICLGSAATVSVSGTTGNIQWQQSVNNTTWTNINGATAATYTTPVLTATTYYKVTANSGACSSATSNTVTVTVNEINSWTGALSTDWNTPGNWACTMLPTINTVVIIPSAPINQPQVHGITGLAKSLTVNAGARVTILTGGTLEVANQVTVAATGTVTVQNNAALVQDNDVVNSGAITVIKNSNPLYRLDYTMWSSPVKDQNLLTFSPQTSVGRFYEYKYAFDATLNANVEQYFIVTPSTTTFEAAKGYLIRMPNGDSTPGYNGGTASLTFEGTFTGQPNNGTITRTASIEGNRYTAVGNPYASPISINDFFDQNQGVLDGDSGLYFWRKKNNYQVSSYATVTKACYTANRSLGGGNEQAEYFTGSESNWLIAAGQGFIVKTAQDPTNANITFTNSMRRAAPTTGSQSFFRTAQSTASRIWLNLTGAESSFSQAAIAYMDNATTGIDYGYDGKKLGDNTNISLYSLAGETNLTIQARPSFTVSDVVPMGFNATATGQYTIAIDHTDGIFTQGQVIYLKDNLLGTITSLEQAYTFTSETGTFNTRFEVMYTNGVLGNNTPQLNTNTVMVYKEGSAININTGAAEMTDVTIYDIRGRKLYSNTAINATTASVTNLQAAQEVLIVEINTVKGKVSKKIIF